MTASASVGLCAALLMAQYHYRPFQNAPDIAEYWYLLLLPLCLGVSIVYKSIKCQSLRQVPREAGIIFGMMIGGIALSAVLLAVLLRWIESLSG